MQINISNLPPEVESLHRLIATLHEKNNDWEAKYIKLSDENISLVSKCTNLSSQKTSLIDECKKLADDNSELLNRVNKLEEQLAGLKARSLLSFLKLDDKYWDFSDNIKFIYPVNLL